MRLGPLTIPCYNKIIMDNIEKMDNKKIMEIVSKFEMPDGDYILVRERDEFGEGECYWVIENISNHSKFLLVCTYWHPGVEQEIEFYQKNGFNIQKPILRKYDTLEVREDKNNPTRRYLFYDLYALFEIRH